MLVPTVDRLNVLKNAGVPHSFLEALAQDVLLEALAFVLKAPESTYWYYERYTELLERYGALSVVPLGEGANGDEFFDFVVWKEGGKFVVNELEGSWREISSSPQGLAFELAVRAYELHDRLSVGEIAQQLESLGFPSVFDELKQRELRDA